MMPTQIIVPSKSSRDLFEVELTAIHEGVLLPPGVWMVRRPGQDILIKTTVEEMPKHWRDEIDEAYRVGRMLRLDGPHGMNPGTGDE